MDCASGDNKLDRSPVTIVGGGRVGTAVGLRLHQAGFRIKAVVNRSLPRAKEAVRRIGDGAPSTNLAEACRGARYVFITVPDQAVGGVARDIRRIIRPPTKDGKPDPIVLIHTSGVLGAAALGPAEDGIGRLSMHPIQTIVDPVAGAASLTGSFWGVEGDPEALPVGRRLVETMEGVPLTIAPGQKALYHAAAAVGSNFVVALMAMGLTMFQQAGLTPDDALAALLALMTETVDNIRTHGVPAALTGPIERGDAETVRAHIEAIRRLAVGERPRETPADIEAAYRAMGSVTLAVARAKMAQAKAAQVKAAQAKTSEDSRRAVDRWDEIERLLHRDGGAGKRHPDR